MPASELSRLLATLKIPPDTVLNVYLVGSRLWGTHKSSSDTDLLVVFDDVSSIFPTSLHKNQYDVTTITKAQFSQRVRDGHLIETVCCLMEESQPCVWQHKQSFRHLVEGSGNIERWVSSRMELDREKAKKFWNKGMAESGLKVLRHMLHAELVKRELQRREGSAGDLASVQVTMLELHNLVLDGKQDEEWEWYGLSWEEVERAHSIRLHEMSRKHLTEGRSRADGPHSR